MKIVLGDSWINYQQEVEKDLRETIVSEVVESCIFPREPVFVRSIEELQALFGKKFGEFDYLSELLSTNKISLFLSGAYHTKTKNNILDKYFFLPDTSPQTEKVLLSLSDTENFTSEENLLPDAGDSEKIYKVVTKRGPYYDKEKDVYFNYYKYLDTQEVFTACQKNDIKKDVSSDGIDLLSIGENGMFCYPTAFADRNNIEYNYINFPSDIKIYSLQENIDKGITSKYLLLNLSDIKTEDFDNQKLFRDTVNSTIGTYYFALPKFIKGENEEISIEYNYFLYSPNEYGMRLNPANDNFTGLEEPLPNVSFQTFSTVEELRTLLDAVDFLTKNEDNTYILEFPKLTSYSFPFNMPKTFYYWLPFLKNQDYLYDTFIKPCELYRFSSKTFGYEGSEGEITVSIEKSPDKDNFYVTILRYDYEEFFEGPFIGKPGKERLDHIISRESKLIDFEILVEEAPENGWVLGYWKLRGSREFFMDLEKADFDYSLDSLMENNYITDFILVPNKDRYSDLKILNAAENSNCQALIVNTTPNVKTNLVSEDPNNRLIYLFGDFLFGDIWKPGYDVFLRGLLENNYLPSIKRVIYPVGYIEELPEDLNLEDYKSNFLAYNDYFYYYNKYFSGSNYNTTALVRFVISKISRSLERYKWNVLGQKMNSDFTIKSKFEEILLNIQNTYTIIRSIEVTKFFVNRPYQKLQANILTKMSDLISEDVSFDIILNYNKNQT